MLHVLVGSVEDHKMLRSGRRTVERVSWRVPKDAEPGEHAVFFLPGAGLAASGEIATRPKAGSSAGEYVANVEKFRFLDSPVSLHVVRQRMPRRGWAKQRRNRGKTSIHGAQEKQLLALLRSYPGEASAMEGILREARHLSRGRSRALRNEALALAGGTCEACRKNFTKLLDGLGVRVLHVHHRRQLAANDMPRVVYVGDLAVVCANCHALIHADPRKTMKVAVLRRRLSA